MEEEAAYDDQLDESESDVSDESMEEDEGIDDSIQIGARDLQQALLDEEKNGTSMQDIKELWSSSQPAIESANEGISLFTTYIYLLRRLGADTAELKATFQEGRSTLTRLFGNQYWDDNACFRKNFAYFLYTKARQPEEALKLWNDILSSHWRDDLYSWIEVVRLERHFGQVENARSLLYRGIQARFDEPYDFFDYFIQFEREEGTREQVDAALEKINTASAKRPQQRPRERGDGRRERGNDRGDRGKPTDKKERKRKSDTQGPESEKFRKVVKISNDGQNGEKNGNSKPPQKDADGFVLPSLPAKQGPKSGPSAPSDSGANSENPERTIFLSNVPFSWTAEDVRKQFPQALDVRIPHKGRGQNKGFAFIDFSRIEDAQEALQLNGKLQVDGRDIQIFPNREHPADEKPEFRFATGQESNKLFVRNLNFKSSAEDLREFFGQFGAVKDVRIVHHKNGKPKGVAYVEFTDEAGARSGLKANEKEFSGRQLEVHISNPSLASARPPQRAPSDAAHSLGSGRVKTSSGFSLKPRVLLGK